MYNVSFMNTTNTITDYYTGINAASNDLLSILILLLIWVISFIAMKHFDTKVVFLSSSFLTTIVGLFFLIAGWIHFAIFIIPLVMTMFSIVIVIFSKG